MSRDRAALIYFEVYPPDEYLLIDLLAPSGVHAAIRGRFKDKAWSDSAPLHLAGSEPLDAASLDERTETLREFDVRWFRLQKGLTPAGEISIGGRRIRLNAVFLNAMAFSPTKEFVAITSNTSGGSGVFRAEANYKSLQIFRLSDLTEVFAFNFGGEYGYGSTLDGWLPNSTYVSVIGNEPTRIQIIRPR